MINNQQGPDRGLLDMVFGKKQNPAQANEPKAGGASGEDKAVKQVPEDFRAMLVKKAQDQKAAAAAEAALKTKDGSKQVTKSAGATGAAKKEAAAALAKQMAKVGGAATQEKKAVKAAKTEEEQDAKADTAAAALGALLAQMKSEANAEALQGAAGPRTMPAMTAAQAQQMQALHQQQAMQHVAATQNAAAKAAASTAGGVPGAGAGAQAVAAAQQAAVAAQQAAVTAQQAAQMVMQQGIAQSQAAQANAQPVVIQMPMAIPVEILGVESGDMEEFDKGRMKLDSAVGGSKPQLTSSQDFLAQLGIKQGGVLGVDRMDPRLGRYNDERQPGQSNDRSNDGNLSMMVPQLNAQAGQTSSDTTTGTPVSSSVQQVTIGQNGNPVLANTRGLANEVATLAARGGGEVRVRIVPENLGEVTISVKTEGQHLNVQIETANSAARDAVASAMPELRQMLTASNYKVGSLEVNHAAAGGQIVMSRAGDGVGMSQWSNQSSFSDWQGGGRQDDQGGSAWDRYRTQQEARQEAKQQQQYRQQSGYRRYRQEQLEA